MAVSGIPRKKFAASITVKDYELLQELAKEEKMTVTAYIRRLVTHHLWDKKVERYSRSQEE